MLKVWEVLLTGNDWKCWRCCPYGSHVCIVLGLLFACFVCWEKKIHNSISLILMLSLLNLLKGLYFRFKFCYLIFHSFLIFLSNIVQIKTKLHILCMLIIMIYTSSVLWVETNNRYVTSRSVNCNTCFDSLIELKIISRVSTRTSTTRPVQFQNQCLCF